MGVNAAFQKLARFAGQGVIFGGSLYYALKEYGTYTFGNQDLLKESYRNLTESMNSRKIQEYYRQMSSKHIPMPLLGSIAESQSIYNAPEKFHSENIGHDFNLQNTTLQSAPIVIFRSLSALRAEEEADNAEITHEMYIEFLRKVPILENLSEAERHIVADALEPVTFKKGDVIMEQGDPGKDFFIIVEGNVVCTQYIKKGETPQEVGHLGPSAYFGEIALLLNQPRRATVTVVSDELKCVRLDKKGFETVMGPCTNILRRSIQSYSSAISLKLSMPSF